MLSERRWSTPSQISSDLYPIIDATFCHVCVTFVDSEIVHDPHELDPKCYCSCGTITLSNSCGSHSPILVNSGIVRFPRELDP